MLFLSEVCEDSNILKIFYFINELLDILFLLVPIGLILMISVDFLKSVIANQVDDMKKNLNLVIKRIIMAVGVFFVPTIVDFSMSLLGNVGVDYTKCYTNANLEAIKSFENTEKANATDYVYQSKEVNLASPGGGASVAPDAPSSSDDPSSSSSSDGTSNVDTGVGMGKAKKITIRYNVKDSKGRCGKKDNCASIATVEYEKGTVKYYMGKQAATGLNAGRSCRVNAFMCATNAVTDSYHSSLDLVNYLKSIGKNDYLASSTFPKAIKKYGVTAKVYHDEVSKADAVPIIEKALDNGQPVMIFVSKSICPDLAVSQHALLLLGYDEDGKVVFLDSGNKALGSGYKKRTLKQMGKCLSSDRTSKTYYRMVVFSFS